MRQSHSFVDDDDDDDERIDDDDDDDDVRSERESKITVTSSLS
jgi:hypothetical protein